MNKKRECVGGDLVGVALLVACGTAFPVLAEPTGGVVTSGTGTISSGTTTTITQSSARLDLNWATFNIASNERVVFAQTPTQVAVNRILDVNPTQIFGRLDAGGHVYLLNPNGIIFGQGANVNVGSLVASAIGQTTINGVSYNMGLAGAAGAVQVLDDPTRFPRTTLTANSTAGVRGNIVLLGGAVRNQGTITADGGGIALGAGSQVVVALDSAGLLGIEITDGVRAGFIGVSSAINNSGTLQANGGRIELDAQGRSFFDLGINQTGVIAAQAVNNVDGNIVLTTEFGASVQLVGSTRGNNLELNGPRIGLVSNLDLTGDLRINSIGSIGDLLTIGEIRARDVYLDGPGFKDDGNSSTRLRADTLHILPTQGDNVGTFLETSVRDLFVEFNRNVLISQEGDITLHDINITFGGSFAIRTTNGNIHLAGTVRQAGDYPVIIDAGDGRITVGPNASISASATRHRSTSLPLDQRTPPITLSGSQIGTRINPLNITVPGGIDPAVSPYIAVLLRNRGQQDPDNIYSINAIGPAGAPPVDIRIFDGGSLSVPFVPDATITANISSNRPFFRGNLLAERTAAQGQAAALDAASGSTRSTDDATLDFSVIDPSISLFGSAGTGIRLPADQSEETEQASVAR